MLNQLQMICRRSRPGDWRRRTAVACLALLLCAACGGHSDPPTWDEVIAGKQNDGGQAPPPAPAPATANSLVVYLDTSVSMAGYVSADRQGQTIYSRSLQELRNFVSIVAPPLDVTVRRVDAAVSAPNTDALLSQASFDKGIYTGKETNLAGAISLFNQRGDASAPAKPQKASGSQPPQADAPAPPPARFHVLVTDGVQSQRQKSGGDCLAGSDQVCVRKRLLALLDAGWGGYVIGLRSEFQGKVFSETGGGPVNFTSNKTDAQTFRPFYIYVFSPDRAALDQLVTTLTERLRPLLPNESAMRTLALSSAYTNGFAPAKLGIADAPNAAENPAKLLELESPEHENPPGFAVHVELDTERGAAPVPFNVETSIPWSASVRDGGAARELAALVDWKLVVDTEHEAKLKAEEGNDLRFPELKLTGQDVGADGQIVLHLNAKFPLATGKPEWRVYRLEGHLNLQQQTPQWIRDWSTNLDTSVEAANKTLYLESALLGLWRNPELEKQTVAQIYLVAGP